MYYFKSPDGFVTTKVEQIERSIASIFKDTDVDFNEELELIFSYIDNQIVFMTLNWFYVFDLDLFTIESDLTSSVFDFYFILKIKKNIPVEKFVKRRHCLWRECQY